MTGTKRRKAVAKRTSPLAPLAKSDERIFVYIASYRDTECQWTVKDLFEKARNPERIFVGICWQTIPAEDRDCFQFETRPSQCRTVEFDARQSRGVGWARAKAQALWRGEEYVLQIDSHMRFIQDWDAALLEMLASCDSAKPILSSYPASYVPPAQLGPRIVATIQAREFNALGVLELASRGVLEEKAPAAAQKNPFCAAGLLFGPASLIKEVPYDPFIYFRGEEIMLAARLWTHGWDVFEPNRVIAFHDYTKGPARRRHWQDNPQWPGLNNLSAQRVRHLLGTEVTTNPDALCDIEKYGLGTARALKDYQAFSRVDFHKRLIDGKTSLELKAAPSPEDRRRQHTDIFTRIYKTNAWGSSESKSGTGSTAAATETIRAELLRLFEFLHVRQLLDAGCGDLNWAGLISERLDLYLGMDVVDEMIVVLQAQFGRRRGHFFSIADICFDAMPKVDAILCRDVLTHLPDSEVREALAQFRSSDTSYLIATTFPAGRNDAINAGGWRPLDLTAPPFNLPPPRFLISECLKGSSKSLGVWHIGDLSAVPS